MIIKSFNSTDVTVSDAGRVSASFSVYNNVDGDGDIVMPGAITDGAQIVLSAWQHGSHQAGQLPIGRGRVRTTSGAAIIDADLFDTQTARDTATVLRGLGDLGRWSFGFNILEHDYDVVDGRRVRLLTRLDVIEASPVLVPSNPMTRTLAVSERDDDDAATAMARLVAAQLDAALSGELSAIRDSLGAA